MNVQCSLILEHILYEFKLGHNIKEASKNIYCIKGKRAVDHSTITWWFKKFCFCDKKLDNQTRSGRPKIVNSKTVLQTITANLMNSIQRVSGELSISHFSEVQLFHSLSKSVWSLEIVLHVTKILQSFWLTFIICKSYIFS